MNKFRFLMATLGLMLGGHSIAQDSSFEREFSRFDKDFERLNSWKAETPASKKLKRAPAPATTSTAHPTVEEGKTTPLDAEPVSSDSATEEKAPDLPKPDKTSAVHGNLPKDAQVEKLAHSDLIGNQISDPVMRKKVQDLYKRSDVVVQQYVLPTN